MFDSGSVRQSQKTMPCKTKKKRIFITSKAQPGRHMNSL